LKILVTGGAGYKGVKLVSKLLDKGFKVSVLDNFMYGFEPFLHLVENDNLKVIKQDIRNKIDNLNKYDTIFHLAGLSGLPACAANPSSAQLINVEATKQLASSLGKNQRLIYASTTSFYIKWDSSMPDDMMRKCLDVSRLKEMGYRPRISLSEGVLRTIEEYRERKRTGTI